MASFENNILLKLKRKYSEDEEMAFLIQKMKEIEFKNGMLTSEIAEVRALLKAIKIERRKNQNYIACLEKEKEELKKENAQLSQENPEQKNILKLEQELEKIRAEKTELKTKLKTSEKEKKRETERFIASQVKYHLLLNEISKSNKETK